MVHSICWPLSIIICGIVVAGYCKEPASEAPASKPAKPRITSHVDVKQVTHLNEREVHEISFAAGRILKHVSKARADLHAKQADQARAEIEQGLKVVAIIEDLLPKYVVKTEIKAGDHVYCDEDKVMPEYVTLFSELEQRDIVSPVVQAKREHTGKHAKTAQAPASTPYAIAHEDIHYSAIKLNVALAARDLGVAKQRLADGRQDMADEALLNLQVNGVVFEYEEIDLPLKEAADNLKLAERELKLGKTAEASAALKVASEQLKHYEKAVGDTRGADVKALHREIDELTKELATTTATEAAVQKHAETVSGWWARTRQWFKTK